MLMLYTLIFNGMMPSQLGVIEQAIALTVLYIASFAIGWLLGPTQRV